MTVVFQSDLFFFSPTTYHVLRTVTLLSLPHVDKSGHYSVGLKRDSENHKFSCNVNLNLGLVWIPWPWCLCWVIVHRMVNKRLHLKKKTTPDRVKWSIMVEVWKNLLVGINTIRDNILLPSYSFFIFCLCYFK